MTIKKAMPTIILGAICLVVALLLSVANFITAPIIEAAERQKVQENLANVLPSGNNFVETPKSELPDNLPDEVTNVFTEDNGGFVFQMTVTGYKPGLVVMCGIDTDGKITGATYVKSQETLSAEVGLGEKFIGYTGDTITTEIIAGPTAKKTTEAYYRAIEAALEAFDIINEKEGVQ
jgi:Na+-translocating ferredoxin:NAD+ oxidoreductase RnfG subunit